MPYPRGVLRLKVNCRCLAITIVPTSLYSLLLVSPRDENDLTTGYAGQAMGYSQCSVNRLNFIATEALFVGCGRRANR